MQQWKEGCGGESVARGIAHLSDRPEMRAMFAYLGGAAQRGFVAGKQQELTRLRLGAGEPVYHVGDAAERLVLVRRGAVKISRPCMGRGEATLELLGPGRCFGWAALRGGQHSFQAEAVGDTELFGVAPGAVRRTLSCHPDLALQALNAMAAHLNATQHWTASLSAYTAAERVARLLARLAAEFGQPREGGTEIAVRLNQEDLARMVGTTRETVSHSLHKLRRSGAVIRARSPYVVSVGALVGYCES